MIQCFVKKNYTPSFKLNSEPRLVYVSKIEQAASIHPRVMHAHEDLVEIVLITGGSGEYSIGGVRHKVQRGNLAIYNSGVVHDELSGPDVLIGSYCCAVGGLRIEGLRENALISDKGSPVFSVDEAQCARLESLMDLMFSELVSGQGGGEETSHHLLLALLTCCWHVTHGEVREEEYGGNVLGTRIKTYIDTHFSEDISLQSISDQLNVSPYYLSHVFKDMTGYSPLQYIVRRRIGEAQTLLISTNYPVTRIASMVGYDNPSHFNLLFAKNVGMTPRKYRKNYIVSSGEK
ncbi:MAG: AraC family transcriptional regulator [Intestinibacillus sp.]